MDESNIVQEHSRAEGKKLFGIKLPKITSMPAYIVMLLAVLLPIIFLPVSVTGFQTTKVFVFMTLTLLTLGFWVFTRLKNDTFVLPFNLLTLSIILVPLVYLITSLFSGNVSVSILGKLSEIDTTLVIATLFVLMGLVASVFQDLGKTFKLYSVILISFLIVSVFHILRLVFLDFMPNFGFFGSVTTNTVGKWNDLAIFSGLIIVMILTTLESIKSNRNFKIVQYSAMVLAIALLILVNFTLVWYLVGIFALLFFVYFFSVNRAGSAEEQKLPATSLVVLLISFFFIISGSTVGPFVSGMFNIDYTEVRPSWTGTFQIVKNVMVSDPITGVGPARFSSAWQDHKPSNINQTDYWNTDFSYGVGYIPSSFATTGIPGVLAWAFFFVMLIGAGFKALFQETSGRQGSRFILASSFIASLYMWVTMFMYVPSMSTLALTFIFTGIFISSLYRDNLLRTVTLDLKNNAKFGFLYVFALVLILVGVVAYEFDNIKRFASSYYFQQANIALNVNGDLPGADGYIRQALSFHRNDAYYRSLSELSRIQINQLIADQEGDQATLAAQFRNALSNAVAGGQAALDYDPTNYLNYVILGDIYQTIVPLGVEGAYEQSKTLYNSAIEINSNNPSLNLSLARLELANGNADAAREEIGKALSKKVDYTDAIFLLSQIDVSEGKTSDAIANVESAAVIKPNDPIVFFQLGLLRYSNEEFEIAVSAFERAVILNPVYSNAKYFLGLSYDRVGKTEDAIAQFEDLQILNQGNEEVNFILENLKQGNTPFTGAEAPIDSQPENRDELPVDETADTIEEEA
ncbi:MAG: tetratricopeptide (TPR) repeat protein [Candidatus Paceibacteria bacterium]|jgi:tetratricopeptide (TPR) repeat protein